MAQVGVEQGALLGGIGGAARERRQSALRRFRIGEHVRRVGPAIDRAAAEFQQPHRLALRDPRGGRTLPHAAQTHPVRIAPPLGQRLRTEDVGLTVSTVGDRRAPTRRPVGGGGVIPVERLAGADPTLQKRRAVGVTDGVRIVVVAGVAQRRIPVDRHLVDVRIRPQSIERKQHVAAAVGGHVRAVLGPVGTVDDFTPGQQLAHLGRQRAQRVDGGELRAVHPHPGEPDQLGADHKPRHAADRRAQCRVMQHRARISPVAGRPGIRAVAAKMRRPGIAEKRLHVGRRAPGDPPAPGIRRLPLRIALRNVAQQQRIEPCPNAALLQQLQPFRHRRIGRSAAVGRPAGIGRGHRSTRPRIVLTAPDHRPGHFTAPVDPRRDRALTRPQIIGKPPDRQRRIAHVRRRRRQIIQRGHEIRHAAAGIAVLVHRHNVFAHRSGDRRRKLAGPRNETHRAQRRPRRIGILRRTQHLEIELRNAVAERRQRQVFKHNVRQSAVGGRRAAVERRPQRIRHLRFGARIKAPEHGAQIERLLVGAHGDQPRHRPLANADRQRNAVTVRGHVAAALAADVAGGGPLAKPRGTQQLPGGARAPEHQRHRTALARAHDIQLTEPRPDNPAAAAAAAENRGVNRAADQLTRHPGQSADGQIADQRSTADSGGFDQPGCNSR